VEGDMERYGDEMETLIITT
jgi:hypothetical protein